MYLKPKPIKPTRSLDRTATLVLYEDNTPVLLYDLIERTHTEATLEIIWGGDDVVVRYPDPETEEEFAARMAEYESELAEYNAWLAENKDAVAAENRKAKAQRERQKQREIAKKEQQLARLQKELDQLTR